MTKVSVCRQVDLNQDECTNLALELLDKLVTKFGGSYSSQASGYRYKHGAGVDAVVEAKEGELSIDVKLGIMARRFAPQLEKEMNRVIDQHLST